MAFEIVGPRVSADRNGTADRGGGQLVIKDGRLLVRARNLERVLGQLIAIDYVQLVDLARLRAAVRFGDGQVWNVRSEHGEDLTPFFQQLEAAANRGPLVRDPPRLSELARAAATPDRVRLVLFTLLGLIAFLPLRWLGGLAAPLAVIIAVLAVAALLVGVAALLRGVDGPPLLARLRPRVGVPWLAAALAACAAGFTGYADASARAAAEERQARARAEAEQRAAEENARKQAEARARKTEADALSEQLLAAMRAKRFRDAEDLRNRITALVPDHPVAAQIRPQLDRALAELEERERSAGVARGIAQARALAKDPLACETAKRVADAHALLRRAQPSDANYDAAQRALRELERCRKRVLLRFAQSAEDGRLQRRMLAAPQIEAAVRRLGYPATVTLAGRTQNVLRIEARELDARAAARILALSEPNHPTFEAARADEGFARIELRGHRFSRAVRLRPVPPSALVEPVLQKFGLAEPLLLASAEP